MDFLVWASGVAATVSAIGAYAARTRHTLTLAAAAAVALWALHFALQSAWTPAVLNALMAVRVAACSHIVYQRPAVRWTATLLFGAIAATGAALTWQGWISVPSTVATLFLTWAGFHLWYTPLRVALLVGEALWFANGLLVGSPLAMVAAVAAAVLNVVVMVRDARARAALREPPAAGYPA